MPRPGSVGCPWHAAPSDPAGIEGRSIGADETDRRECVERLGRRASKLQTDISGWALLTNHAHLLLCSGPQGLPTFMRRLLTGSALASNQRYHRHGLLFQSRYKSIVCEEAISCTELIRYI